MELKESPRPTSGHQEIVGVVHYGLGPIGKAVADLVRERPGLRSVAAVDPDPQLQGQRLGHVQIAPRLTSDLLGSAAIAIHCTSSSLSRVAPQLLELVGAGLNVVSTCEELSFPWATEPRLSAELDAAAKAKGVSILGTGVNPGYAMDYLPIVLSGVARSIDRVRVTRVQDASTRRLPLQRKVGAGLTVSEFERRVAEGSLGHVGLRQSIDALAAAFGWQIDEYEEATTPVPATKAVSSGVGEIAPGDVLGLHQVATGQSDGHKVVELDLTMAIGMLDPADRIELFGSPNLELLIPGGLHGDVATASIVVNAIRRVVDSAPGLRVMSELAPPHP
jgi:4-hydroxy-tetrahydrodipicolinate reductase